MRTADFFAFARERHAIHLRRQLGDARPWTDDTILQTYRFTNVFRELDRTTVWFRENVRDRLAELSPYDQVLGTILFRTLNRIATCEVLFCQERLFGNRQPIGWQYVRGWADIADVEAVLRVAIPSGPWVTGAYIVKTPDGMDKLRGALWIVEEARKRLPATLADLARVHGSTPPLQALWEALLRFPYYGGGGFMAYEVVTDLRHLPIGRDAADVLTWANAGPGAKRGLNRILGRDKDHRITDRECLELMRLLLAQVREVGPDGNDYWPEHPDWPLWEMREVEHTLCEWDKFERVRLGEGRPRGVYR